MTCFWDALREGIPSLRAMSPHDVITYLKHHNHQTPDVCVNRTKLTARQLEENHEWIACLHLEDGYACSTCDPVLCLACDLFRYTVIHDMAGCTTVYQRHTDDPVLRLASSRSHCRFVR